MIELSSQICDVLGLTYWQQLASGEESIQAPQPTINREEKELLRKILLAKGITLSEDMMVIESEGVIRVQLNKLQLVFNDVSLPDQPDLINLAKISDMLVDQQHKKLTWYKLKNLDL